MALIGRAAYQSIRYTFWPPSTLGEEPLYIERFVLVKTPFYPLPFRSHVVVTETGMYVTVCRMLYRLMPDSEPLYFIAGAEVRAAISQEGEKAVLEVVEVTKSPQRVWSVFGHDARSMLYMANKNWTRSASQLAATPSKSLPNT